MWNVIGHSIFVDWGIWATGERVGRELILMLQEEGT